MTELVYKVLQLKQVTTFTDSSPPSNSSVQPILICSRITILPGIKWDKDSSVSIETRLQVGWLALNS